MGSLHRITRRLRIRDAKMPRIIYKYPVAPDDSFTLELPIGAQYLHSSLQPCAGGVFMWLLIDPDAEKVPVKFHVIGTGHRIADDMDDLLYLDTFYPMPDGSLVFHLFVENLCERIKSLEDVIGVLLLKTIAFKNKDNVLADDGE